MNHYESITLLRLERATSRAATRTEKKRLAYAKAKRELAEAQIFERLAKAALNEKRNTKGVKT